jgi:hypothetical protein
VVLQGKILILFVQGLLLIVFLIRLQVLHSLINLFFKIPDYYFLSNSPRYPRACCIIYPQLLHITTAQGIEGPPNIIPCKLSCRVGLKYASATIKSSLPHLGHGLTAPLLFRTSIILSKSSCGTGVILVSSILCPVFFVTFDFCLKNGDLQHPAFKIGLV